MSRVRTRYAPSPTGRMHVGNLRTAPCAYLIAKHEGGDLLLHTEDTDQERFVGGAVGIIYRTPKDTDLIHDKGPDKGGGYSPYVQSERQVSGVHLEYAKRLVEKGKTCYCFCAPERLAALRITTNEEEIITYDRHCLHLTKKEAEASLAAGMPYVIHQDNPITGTAISRDEVCEDVIVDNSELDDMILIKSDGYPTYNFANVVDDHPTGATHVVKGNEYLPSSPKYSRLYATFGWDVPAYVYCPLIADESHHRLSRKSEHFSFEDFLGQGFISQVVMDHMVLLSWSPENNREMFILEEMTKKFDHHCISKSPAVFDMIKLKRVNDEYVKAMDFDTFYEMAGPYSKAATSRDLDLKKIASTVKARVEVFPDIADHVDFFETLPEHDIAMYAHKKMETNLETSLKVLKDVLPLLKTQEDLTNDALYGVLSGYVEDTRIKTGFVIWSIRIAAPGKQMMPAEVTEIMEVLGKEESLARTHKGIQIFEV